jgi:hypothetical protein
MILPLAALNRQRNCPELSLVDLERSVTQGIVEHLGFKGVVRQNPIQGPRDARMRPGPSGIRHGPLDRQLAATSTLPRPAACAGPCVAIDLGDAPSIA